MKAVVAAFNQEKALEGAFSAITNLWMELFKALLKHYWEQMGILCHPSIFMFVCCVFFTHRDSPPNWYPIMQLSRPTAAGWPPRPRTRPRPRPRPGPAGVSGARGWAQPWPATAGGRYRRPAPSGGPEVPTGGPEVTSRGSQVLTRGPEVSTRGTVRYTQCL